MECQCDSNWKNNKDRNLTEELTRAEFIEEYIKLIDRKRTASESN